MRFVRFRYLELNFIEMPANTIFDIVSATKIRSGFLTGFSNSSIVMEPFERIYDVDYEPCDSDSVRGSDSSDDCLEDFENEMQNELDRRVGLQNPRERSERTEGCDARPHSKSHAGEESLPGSSSKEDCGESKQSSNENANDEAFYDPDEDEDNERWAQRQRQKHMFPDPVGRAQHLPNSDAILNCPGCMTVLCRDCQAHETNSGQYRAMFVFNCKIDSSTEVPGPLVKNRAKKKRRRGERQQEPVPKEGEGDKIVFHPVHCNICQTRVGVIDSDEVYHFLCVLAS